MSDLKFAFRQLLKNPGFTAVAVIILALGIGANSTIFTLINAFVLKPMGGREPDRLVGVYSQDTSRPGEFRNFSYPNLTDLRASKEVFEDLYAYSPNEVGITDGEMTQRVFVLNVSASYFSVFGTPVALGRDFSVEDEVSAGKVVIVSHAWWERHGADPGMIGRALTITGRPYTIIGVAARGFTGTVPMFPAQLYFPLVTGPGETSRLSNRAGHDFMVVGRLKPGLTLSEANARLKVVSAQLEQSFPGENRNQQLMVATLPRMAINTAPHDDRGTLGALSALLLAMSCAVLLIACLNLANLLLARGAARRKEIAIRLALGAARRDVLRQLLIEGGLLASLGGVLGLLAAVWVSGWLVFSLNAIVPTPLTLDTRPDGRVIAATLGFAMLATMFFALGPAWKLARGDVNADLKSQINDGAGGGSRFFSVRHGLVVGQVALSLALLVAAGLFSRGAIRAMNVDPGFRFDRGFYVQMDARMAGYAETRTRQVYGEVLERVRGLAGVESATLAATVPLGDRSFGDGVQRAGSPLPPPVNAATPAEGQSFGANYNVIASDYFRTLGISMQRGREFAIGESSSTNLPRVAIINTSLAEKLWPGEDPLGQRLQFTSQGHTGEGPGTFLGSGQQSGQTIEVVGVVAPIRANLNDHTPSPMVFVPYGQARDYWSAMNLHVRVRPTADEAGVMRAVREEVRRIDRGLPVLSAKTLRYHVATNVQVWVIRAGAWLFASLGLVAVLLAGIGVYGVKAYAVARRTREIGIRMALGASQEAVLRQILREGATLTLAGLGVGLLLAAATARAMSGFLFEVQPFDPLVFVGAPLLLAVPALLACWLPARRAARVDPMEALRNE